MITFLSGGTGTPKLLRGMQKVMDRHEISVVVNTAEDIWISGNHISPDLDTVMYLFAGILNTETWWGSGMILSLPMKRSPASGSTNSSPLATWTGPSTSPAGR